MNKVTIISVLILISVICVKEFNAETETTRKTTSHCFDENSSYERNVQVTRDKKQSSVSIVINPEENQLPANLDHILNTIQETQEALKKICAYRDFGTCRKDNKLGVYYNKNIINNPRSDTSYPKSCKELQQNGYNVSGVYEIYPNNAKAPFIVLCDMKTRGGGWIHIQKRYDGSQEFGLKWRDYKFGFGDLDGEFWLGLEKMHLLTGFEQAELLVEVEDRAGIKGYAHYQSFRIGTEQEAYPISILSEFSGDAKDALAHHLGQKFSTIDIDFSAENCAAKYKGGWWYKACFWSNLNGQSVNVDLGEKLKYHGLQWDTFRNTGYSLSKSRMLIRPAH